MPLCIAVRLQTGPYCALCASKDTRAVATPILRRALVGFLNRRAEPCGGFVGLQFGFEGIFGDVTNGGLIVGRVPNDAVKAFVLPDRSFSAKTALDVLSREPFPRIAQVLHPIVTQQTTQGVDVVGHHHIGQHFAALAFEVMQSVCHHLSMPCFPQQAFAVIFVEQSFQFAEACTLKLLPLSPFTFGHRACVISQSLFP